MAADFYKQFRILPESGEGEPPDYIVYELEFVSFLCSLERSALDADRPDQAIDLETAQRVFYAEHLSPWITLFCDRLQENSRLAYYQVLALFTAGFLHDYRLYFKEKR